MPNANLVKILRELSEELRKSSELLRPLTDSEIAEFLVVGVETMDPDIAEDAEIAEEIAVILCNAAEEL
jgi:hypothetical protein